MRAFLAALSLCAIGSSVLYAVAPYREPVEGMPSPEQLTVWAEIPKAESYRSGQAGEQVEAIVTASLDWSLKADTAIADVPLPQPRPNLDLLAKAEQYIGTNPKGWSELWCAKFIAFLAPDLARKVDNPNWARDWADALPKVKKPKPGDIVVLSRGRGGHIGVVKKIENNGDVIAVSGNTRTRRSRHSVVGVGRYSKHRVLAYVSAGG